MTLAASLAHPQIRTLGDSLRRSPGTPTTSVGIAAWAAVAAVVRARSDSAEMLFIKRVERTGDRWSGQVAFPGGRKDDSDDSLQRTAIRETWEEIGVDLVAIGEPLGVLSDVAPMSPILPPLAVRPFVFAAPAVVDVGLGHEVAEVFWIPLDVLLDEGSRVQTEVALPEGSRRVDAIVYSGHVIWGMTYRIISEIASLMR